MSTPIIPGDPTVDHLRFKCKVYINIASIIVLWQVFVLDRVVSCSDCEHIQLLDEEQKSMYPWYFGFCGVDDTMKTVQDIQSLRTCSYYVEGVNLVFSLLPLPLPREVRCLECKYLDKLPYKLATPTHHQNWRCGFYGAMKTYEDVYALRYCKHYKEVDRVW